MASLLPRYDASRMLGEYVSKFYLPASRQGRTLPQTASRRRRRVAAWKAHVRGAWSGVRRGASTRRRAASSSASSLPVEVAVKLNGLAPADVCVELLLTRSAARTPAVAAQPRACRRRHADDGDSATRSISSPGLAGRLDYRIRIYPRHELLTHPFELGLCAWV